MQTGGSAGPMLLRHDVSAAHVVLLELLGQVSANGDVTLVLLLILRRVVAFLFKLLQPRGTIEDEVPE